MALSQVPAWVWILLAVAAVVVTPIKLRVWKNILSNARKKQEARAEDE